MQIWWRDANVVGLGCSCGIRFRGEARLAYSFIGLWKTSNPTGACNRGNVFLLFMAFYPGWAMKFYSVYYNIQSGAQTWSWINLSSIVHLDLVMNKNYASLKNHSEWSFRNSIFLKSLLTMNGILIAPVKCWNHSFRNWQQQKLVMMTWRRKWRRCRITSVNLSFLLSSSRYII